jgi:hypothetical protein
MEGTGVPLTELKDAPHIALVVVNGIECPAQLLEPESDV